MKLILTQDVLSLGTIGDIVNVKKGYARNYLLPRSMAAVANENNIKELEHNKKVYAKRKAKLIAEFQEQAEKISKVKLTITKQVGEENRIFGSVTTAEIEELLMKEGHKISRKQIEIPSLVKTTGIYDVHASLHSEVTAKFKIEVVSA